MGIYDKLVAKFGQVIALLLIALVVIAILFGGYHMVKRYFTHGVKTEATLGKNQTNAAIESGHDAVETINNRQSEDAANQKTVQETRDAINHASDAGGVTNAGRSGLCKLASHRSKPECVQPAPTH